VHPRFELRPDGYPVCNDSAFFIPNIVTPNGDGRNDFFHIQTLSFYPVNTLKMYDRWGREVYSASPYRNDWPKGQAPGTYFYRLELPNSKRAHTGWVEIVR
jgi:gliding motility-associated-like protein